jgi:hypothetical protein
MEAVVILTTFGYVGAVHPKSQPSIIWSFDHEIAVDGWNVWTDGDGADRLCADE